MSGGGGNTPIRRMTMTPLEPRNANGLRGFGFTVRWDDGPAAADQSTGNVGASAGRLHSMSHVPTGSTASVLVDTHSQHDAGDHAGAGPHSLAGMSNSPERAVDGGA